MLKIKSIESVLDIVKSLILNGYIVNVKTIYQDYPREKSIDYFEIDYYLEKVKE